MLRPGESAGHAIAVFPFLKTTGPIQLGTFTFRSTEDTKDLDSSDRAHVEEIAAMLFLKDDLRVRSASYAILPTLDLDRGQNETLNELERVQAIVAYCYSAPRHTFGDVFFHFEHASLAIFSPEPVTTFLVKPDHHVVPVGDSPVLSPDEWHRVPGYQGRYNFRQPFWVAKGSRLYPPVPHLTLNDSQCLAADVSSAFAAKHHQLLPLLLRRPIPEVSERVLTAIDWYNRANCHSADDSESILCLAVGFEALLALPKDEKTERFIDSVSLLLGRVERLDLWAKQFYAARSDVAHQGRTLSLRLRPVRQKGDADIPLYQSLLSYGRQIFQLCVGVLLLGAHLAESAGIRDKLVTNQERFEAICKTLNDDKILPAERLGSIDQTVTLIAEFQYVIETGLRIDTMLGAVQAAAKSLSLSANSLSAAVSNRVSELAQAKRSEDWHEVFAATASLHEAFGSGALEPSSPEGIMRRLVDVVWHYTFMHYFWLKDHRSKAQEA